MQKTCLQSDDRTGYKATSIEACKSTNTATRSVIPLSFARLVEIAIIRPNVFLRCIMEFLYSARFVTAEVWFLLVNIGYIAIYVLIRGTVFAIRVWRLFHARREVRERFERHAQETVEDPDGYDPHSNRPILSREDRKHIQELVSLVRLKIARGALAEARVHVVAGLSIDKFDRDLNLLLASLYEANNDHAKAELVYKDLIVLYAGDPEIYLRLARSLALQEKYEIAYEVYRRLLEIDPENFEARELFASVAFTLEKYEEAREAARRYLKKFPANIEMMHLLAESHICLEDHERALEVLEKIQNLEPYNHDIRSLIDRIRHEHASRSPDIV